MLISKQQKKKKVKENFSFLEIEYLYRKFPGKIHHVSGCAHSYEIN